MILRTWCGSHIDSKEYTWKICFLWIQGWFIGLLPWNIKRTIQINLKQIIREKITANATCINCKYWNFDSGIDCLPDNGWESFCSEGHWHIDGFGIDHDKYRQQLLSARKCNDFSNWG